VQQIKHAQQKTSQEKSVPEQETVHIITMGNEFFCITQEMLQVDEETTHKPLKYIVIWT